MLSFRTPMPPPSGTNFERQYLPTSWTVMVSLPPSVRTPILPA